MLVRREDVVAVGLLVGAGLGLTIAMLALLRPPGFWVGAVVPGVGISALWIGLLLDTAIRLQLVEAARIQDVARIALTTFFAAWVLLAQESHLRGAPLPIGVALMATLLVWRRSWPETWRPEFRPEA